MARVQGAEETDFLIINPLVSFVVLCFCTRRKSDVIYAPTFRLLLMSTCFFAAVSKKNCKKVLNTWRIKHKVLTLQSFSTYSFMGKFTAYKLPLKSLTKGTHTFDYHLDKQFFSNMENADVRDADVDVHLTVTHKNDVYDLVFHLTGTVTVACDRCLDNLELPVDTTYQVAVKYGDDYRDDADGMIEIPESDNFLNVAYMIHDTAALAIPIKHVHPLGKCNRAMSTLLKKHRAHTPGDPDAELEDELLDGIDDADTGEAQATDPRWDALRGLGSQPDGE